MPSPAMRPQRVDWSLSALLVGELPQIICMLLVGRDLDQAEDRLEGILGDEFGVEGEPAAFPDVVDQPRALLREDREQQRPPQFVA